LSNLIYYYLEYIVLVLVFVVAGQMFGVCGVGGQGCWIRSVQ
jgi:hypothetical protein